MSNQIVISSGAKVRNLSGVLTGTSGIVNSLGINVPDGIPQLDGSGKILVSQLPNSVMEYKGTWNAATNTPTLANGTGNAGDVYLCNVAGTTNFGAGPITFAVGDQVLYSGTTWEKASGATGTVTSVAVTESGDALTITGSPITTSGTINIGFAGTGSQYIKGDGTLATFPTTIDQSKRLITEVYNSTGATLTKGTVVYINGGQGNLPTITKAQANADNTSAQTYGVVQSDITNNNNGFVVVFGSLTDLDTQAYLVGTQLYLSGTTAGEWTSTKPSAPIHLVYVGIVVRSHPTQGVVEIRIQNGYELEELHDVAISSVANNDGIFYNSSTDLWENKTIGEVLGYTPANDSLVVHLAGNETITGFKTFTNGLELASDGGSNQITSFRNTSSLHAGSTGLNVFGFNGSNNIYFGKGLTNGGIFLWNNSQVRNYTLPNADGTIALTSQIPTNPVGGTGTTNTLPKFTGSSTIGDSNITDTGSLITLGSNTFISSGGLGIGNSTLTSISFRVSKNITGSTISYGIVNDGVIQSGVTSSAVYNQTNAQTAAASFTINNIYHNYANQGTFGAGSVVTNQNGFYAESTLIGATNNYGFRGRIASGTNRWNLYMDGTAANYMAGNLGVGATNADVFSRGDSRILGISGSTTASVAINAATGSAAFLQLGVNNTRTFQLQSNATETFLGTATATPLIFTIAFNERARITTNGKLLIGSTTDANANKLQVTGGGYFSDSITTPAMYSLNELYYVVPAGVTSLLTLYVAGALSGTSATFSSGLVSQGAYTGFQYNSAGTYPAYNTYFGAIGTNFSNSNSELDIWNTVGGGFVFRKQTGASAQTALLTIASSGAATFSSSVTAGDNLEIGVDGKGLLLSKVNVGPKYAIRASSAQLLVNDSSNGFNEVLFFTSSTERMRITSVGNVGIGTSSPTAKVHILGSDWTTGSLSDCWNAPFFKLTPRPSTSNGSIVLTNAGSASTMAIQSLSSTTIAEELCLNPYGGSVLIGGTSVSGSSGNAGFYDENNNRMTLYLASTTTGSIPLQYFFNPNGAVGSISTSGSSTSYNTSSDYRLKQDLKDYNGLDLVSAIKTYDYEWKADQTRGFGVMAHELAEVLPYAVHGEKDGEQMQGVDYSKIVPILVKAIQELNEKIKQLENK